MRTQAIAAKNPTKAQVTVLVAAKAKVLVKTDAKAPLDLNQVHKAGGQAKVSIKAKADSTKATAPNKAVTVEETGSVC